MHGDDAARAVEIRIAVVRRDGRDEAALLDVDVEAVRQAAAHGRLLDAQVALEAVLDLVRLEAEERLALVNARDAPDVRLCERLHAVDGDALEHKERRVDDDRQEHGRRGEQRHALDEAARTASARLCALCMIFPHDAPCLSRRLLRLVSAL